MHRRVGPLLIIIVTWLMALAAPALAGGNGTGTGSGRGAAAPTYNVTTRTHRTTTVRQQSATPTTAPPEGKATTPTTPSDSTTYVAQPLVPEIIPGSPRTQLLPPLKLERLPHTGPSAGLALLGGALVASGSALTGWAARRQQRLGDAPATDSTHRRRPAGRRPSTCPLATRSRAPMRAGTSAAAVRRHWVGCSSSHRRPTIRGPSARGQPMR